jgi:hypothetical protein
MAPVSKKVKKAVKASVRAAATPSGSPEKLKDLSKAVSKSKAAKVTVNASSIPGSAADRRTKKLGKTGGSSSRKTINKRVIQSQVARGEKPVRKYVPKAEAVRAAARSAAFANPSRPVGTGRSRKESK